jgi:glycyl-tRNA synthetase (class II)
MVAALCDPAPPKDPAMADAPAPSVMDQIVSLCKRRGFIYPASEIYGGIRGFWDYGPLGVLLKNNIRDWWWRNMVECPPIGPDGHPVEIVGLDSAIIQHPKTWEASGHVASFNDPMVDDKESKHRFRADKVWVVGFWNPDTISRILKTEAEKRAAAIDFISAVNADATSGSDSPSEATGAARSALRDASDTWLSTRFKDEMPDLSFSVEADGEAHAVHEAISKLNKKQKQRIGYDVTTLVLTKYAGEPSSEIRPHVFAQAFDLLHLPGNWPALSPETQRPSLTEPRPFSLMLDTYPGPIRDEANKAYLRPETAQGIFLEFKNITDTTRVKVPFGVAQVGKSFRNEVTPRNFIFRSREFEQMEMEWFCHPDEALKWYAFWRAERMKWWESLGVKPEHLRFRDHAQDELAFYSKATVDIEYLYPFTAPDFGELEGVAHRGDYDLTQHSKHSGNKLDYFDQDLQLKLKADGASPEDVKSKSRYIPNVIEPASGLTRAVLVLLCEAYRHEKGRSGAEEYLSLKPKFAPIKLGVFPLVNKDGMPEVAEKLYLDLRQYFTCEYDAKQAIGRRYARMDEIGTPFCVTIDGQTLQDQTVTIRERDTMKQERIAIDKVRQRVADELSAA